MRKYNLIANLDKYRRNFVFYCKLGVLVLTAGSTSALTAACNPTNNNTTTPTSIETVTPTDTVSPDITATITPDISVGPTITPIEESKYPKVSVDDLMMYDNVVGAFFGESEGFESDFEKRCEYLKSFNVISEEEARILVAFINEMKYNRKYSILIGDEVKDKYLAYITEENLAKIPDICGKIMVHNAENEDNQIVISSLATDGISLTLKERILLNEVQKVMCEVAAGHTFNLSKINLPEGATMRPYWLKTSTGEKVEVDLVTSSISNVCKYFICAMQLNILNDAANKYGSSDIIKARDRIIQYEDATDDILLNLERLIESTIHFTGEYNYNVYYDPNSQFYMEYNPVYDSENPYEEPIEEKVKVK